MNYVICGQVVPLLAVHFEYVGSVQSPSVLHIKLQLGGKLSFNPLLVVFAHQLIFLFKGVYDFVQLSQL